MTSTLRTRTLGTIGALALALALTGLTFAGGAAPAHADTRSTTFTTSGTFTVPAGITEVHVVAIGASGGRAFTNSAAGGRGARVEADLAVLPGDELMVRVGGRGADGAYPSGGAGGANGGGAGGSFTSGGGGGATDVRMGADALDHRVLVAGGGGGATWSGSGSWAGGDAGAAGTRIDDCPSGSPAQPGTQSAGGLGSRAWDDCAYQTAGGDGAFGTGGAGGFNSGSNNSGGGGGAGWYGGGGGGQFASGAGGSSYVNPSIGSDTTGTLASSGDTPRVVISYDRLAQSVSFGTGTPETAVAGTTYDVTATGGASGQTVTLQLGPATTEGACTLAGFTLTFAHPGTCQVVADQDGDDSYLPGSATHTFTVEPAATVTSLDVGAASISADVRVSTPSTLPSSGKVRFALGEQVVGTVDLVDGTATWSEPVPAGDAAAVTAAFLGTADLAGSTDVASRSAQTPSFDTTTPTSGPVGTTAPVVVTGGASGNPVEIAAEDTSVCTVSGTTVELAHAGTCQVVATQPGDWRYLPAAATRLIDVEPAATTTTVSVRPGTITATVGAQSPSTHVPTGTVRFLVDDALVGTAALVDGRAVLTHVVPAGATRTVAAEYVGSEDARASTSSTTRSDPGITATVTSARNPVAGWYAAPVTVSFACQQHGAALLRCPAARVLSTSGAAQKVTGTVTAVDGGTASVTVADIAIDMVAPVLKVRGVKNGKKYAGSRKPKPKCTATDPLSGTTGCRITQTVVKHSGKRVVMRYVARARDRAGNVTRISGSYTLVAGKKGQRG